MRNFLRIFALIYYGIFLCADVSAQTKSFTFVALGDLPYGDTLRVERKYQKLIASINAMSPAFSIHVGDFKTGSSECSDAEFDKQFDHFNRFQNALIYTPGDNDWTDCHRFPGAFDNPLERLKALRKRFFSEQDSLGKMSIPLDRQSVLMAKFADYPENQRWIQNRVLFVTLHIVGSNNNYDQKMNNTGQHAEFFARDEANIAWIHSAFELAKSAQLDALVFVFQGDVFIEKGSTDLFPVTSGFRTSVGENLLTLAAKSDKPILIIHGDSHTFKFDQPFFIAKQKINNLTRLEVPGAHDVRAVLVTVDVKSASPFIVKLIGNEQDD